MKILILSWYFPPNNEVGALRVGKLAEHLHRQGHEIWVITAERPYDDQSLSVALPPERVIRTKWIDLDHISSPWKWGKNPPSVRNGKAPQRKHGSLWNVISENYMWLIRMPDQQGGWLPYARKEGARLMAAEHFDLIYASCPPFSSLAAAAHLSRRFNVPWIAEYRDTWSRNHYTPKPEWRHRLESFLEERTTRTATAIVAVSDPWAEYYRQTFGKPTAAIWNGFDGAAAPVGQITGSRGLPLVFVHTGVTYRGQRSPKPFFDGIRQSGLTPADVQVLFYGENPDLILSVAAAAGVEAFVKVLPRVPYGEALNIQRSTDVLLLLQSTADLSDIPAKTFEYFAARRPILGVGMDSGFTAKLVRDRNAGLYETNPAAIAAKLRAWVEEKRSTGHIAPLPASAAEGLSRTEQLQKLEAFIAASVPAH